MVKVVSNQAANWAPALAPCSLGLESHPPCWVLVASKFPSQVGGCWLVSLDPPLATCSLDVSPGLVGCFGGLMRYSGGLNTLLGIHRCPSHLLTLGTVSACSIQIINLMFLQVCTFAGMPHSPGKACQNSTLLAMHWVWQKSWSVKGQMKSLKLEYLLWRLPNIFDFCLYILVV